MRHPICATLLAILSSFWAAPAIARVEPPARRPSCSIIRLDEALGELCTMRVPKGSGLRVGGHLPIFRISQRAPRRVAELAVIAISGDRVLGRATGGVVVAGDLVVVQRFHETWNYDPSTSGIVSGLPVILKHFTVDASSRSIPHAIQGTLGLITESDEAGIREFIFSFSSLGSTHTERVRASRLIEITANGKKLVYDNQTGRMIEEAILEDREVERAAAASLDRFLMPDGSNYVFMPWDGLLLESTVFLARQKEIADFVQKARGKEAEERRRRQAEAMTAPPGYVRYNGQLMTVEEQLAHEVTRIELRRRQNEAEQRLYLQGRRDSLNGSTSNYRSSRQETQYHTSKGNRGSAIFKLAAAWGLRWYRTEVRKQSDDWLDRSFAGGAGFLGKLAVDSALRDAYPDATSDEIAMGTTVIIAIMDGRSLFEALEKDVFKQTVQDVVKEVARQNGHDEIVGLVDFVGFIVEVYDEVKK